MSGGGASSNQPKDEKLISSNPNVRNFVIEETVEAGMVLTGTEVKSMRATAPNIRDAFVEVRTGKGKLEAWLLNSHIAPYTHGNIWNHEPLRKRKLLLHAHQIERMFGSVTRDGMTIIPLRMYFKGGVAKIELGVAKGRKKGDKRANLKEKGDRREMDQARKQRL